MYDLAQPNHTPGRCEKCKGTGRYSWGASTNGRMARAGRCYSCRGTGVQSGAQIRVNHTYNRYKIARIAAADFHRDPGEDAADRWSETHGD